LQTLLHAPFAQTAVAFAGVGQGRSHMPQWSTFVCGSTQPSVQSIAGATHSVSHVPPTQVGRAFTAPGQTMLHIPQFDVSVAVTTQEPPHSVVPTAQPLLLHIPLTHTSPLPHAMPHMPQCAAFV
jgi:hypothetical protein